LTISYVSSGTKAEGNNAAVTPGIPGGAQAGDLMLAVVMVRENGATLSTPSGWTLRRQYQSVGFEVTVGVWYRWWQSGDAAPTFTPSGGGANDSTLASISLWRGVDPTQPFLAGYDGFGEYQPAGNLIVSATEGYYTPGMKITVPVPIGGLVFIAGASTNDDTAGATWSATYDNPSQVWISTNFTVLGADSSIYFAAGRYDYAPVGTWSFRLQPGISDIAGVSCVLNPLVGTTYSYSAQGGVKSGGAAVTSGPSVAGWSYLAQGGAKAGGAASTGNTQDWVVPVSGGIILSGGQTEFKRTPVYPDAKPRVVVTVNGTQKPATQITTRFDQNSAGASIVCPGRHVFAAGEPVTIDVDYVRGETAVASHRAFTGVVSSTLFSDTSTLLICSGPADLSGGDYAPSAVFVRGDNYVRGVPDFRARPNTSVGGAVSTSVTTTLGTKSPWFTEVQF